MKCVLILCAVMVYNFQPCLPAHIVAYMPLPFYSHQNAFKPLWLELAKRGHKITLIQSLLMVEGNENITHVLINETYSIINKNNMFDNLGKGQNIIKVLLTSVNAMADAMKYHLNHPEVQRLLRGEEKVDLVITEYLSTIGFTLGKKLNASLIGVVSMDATVQGHASMGNPTHPVMYPDKDLEFSPLLTFKERVVSTLFWFGFQTMARYFLIPLQNRAVKQCLDDFVPAEEAIKDISMLFVNANPLFNIPRPLGPNTINIGGGVHLLEPRPLPKDFQDYLDSATDGVIYFSLGSSITSKQVSNKTRDVFLKTFAQLPYKILWKFDEQPPVKLDNVEVVKWVPQQDVLRHKNMKLFITQAGLQSMEEAIFSYVPMVALPFYGDQPGNARKMVDKGFGLSLDHATIDVATFKNTILEVITNPKYRERTKELADLVKDQPMSGLEKAVWWTEYVLRHKNTNHFKNPAIDIPWYQYLLLDVIAFLVLTTLVVVYAFVKTLQILKWLVWKLYSTFVKKRKLKTT